MDAAKRRCRNKICCLVDLARTWGVLVIYFFFTSRRRHTRFDCDWSSDVCSSDLAQDDSDIDVLGVFDDRNDNRALETCAGSPKLGKVDDIVEFARRTRIDLVLFALPISAETRILEMLKKLWVLPVDIRLSAHTNKLRFRPRSYSYLGKVPTLNVFEAPITDWDLVMKWLFDHFVGSLALLMALPVMALVALAIKLDSPGPGVFRPKRFGLNND